MSEPFIGEIRMFGGNFAPRGWAFCNGQLLDINSHSALFSILGTTYGGDGRTTMGLPEMRGRGPKHSGDGSSGPGLRPVQLGQRGGREEHTLNVAEMPSHDHTASLHAEGVLAGSPNPKNRMLAVGATIYNDPDPANDRTMHANSVKVASAGGGQSFGIEDPYLGVNFIIALEGTYPSRS